MNFLWKVAIAKGIKRGLQALVAYLGSLGLQRFGLTINEAVLVSSLYGLIELLRNWAKHQLRWTWL